MHESFIKYINSYATTPLTESEIEVIKNSFVSKKIGKRQYLLQKGEVWKYSAFIVKGDMRQYSIDEKGVEHIVRLLIENWWAVDRESSGFGFGITGGYIFSYFTLIKWVLFLLWLKDAHLSCCIRLLVKAL